MCVCVCVYVCLRVCVYVHRCVFVCLYTHMWELQMLTLTGDMKFYSSKTTYMPFEKKSFIQGFHCGQNYIVAYLILIVCI